MQPHENQIVIKRFLLSISITAIVFLAELFGGFWTGSLALLSDSAHVFMDVFALVLSFLALRVSARPPDDRHTYGYHRLEVFAAFANGVTLAAISLGIFYEAYIRWQSPEPVKSMEMLVIAGVGLVANLGVALILGGGSHKHDEHLEKDLNLHSAFLHVLGDAISSVGVIIAAGVIQFTHSTWVDPLVSVLIGFIILISSWRVLRSSFHILIEGSPEGISVARVGESLANLPGIVEIHDLHVWNICSGHVALSAHVVVNELNNKSSAQTLSAVQSLLQSQFGIEHTTVQFECIACGQGRRYHC